jgi:hypothetical protein
VPSRPTNAGVPGTCSTQPQNADLLDPHAGDGSADDELLDTTDLVGAFEDVEALIWTKPLVTDVDL